MIPFAFSLLELGALGGFVGAIVSAVVILAKIPSERAGVFITWAQGAAEMQHDLVQNLYQELERKDAIIVRLEAELSLLRKSNASA